MANFPQEIKVKTELQEKTNENNLSHIHLTTMNFGETNVCMYRHNTPREKFKADISVFARPYPIQTPVMGAAEHHLKIFYVPFRILSPQWNSFVTKAPHIPYNGTTVINIVEMPYFTINDIYNLLTDTQIATAVTTGTFDYKINGTNRRLTPLGRHCVKILHQLGYEMIWSTKDNTHIDAMALLAYAKVYCDFYYNNAYYNNTQEFISIHQLFKKDGINAYHVTHTDIKNILVFTQKVFYNESYVTAAWDNPSSPNAFSTIETIEIKDITLESIGNAQSIITNYSGDELHGIGTARIGDNNNNKTQTFPLTQYAIDALKKMTDYCVRFAMAGVREVDRYLSRFGVLLSSEKMQRSVYYGEQITPMEFGAVYSTAATGNANIGDYAGQSIINSDGKEHKTFEIESDEYGIIIGISTIIPKVNYFQGIDRNNLHHEIETYFNGAYDQLGSQAISQAEILVSDDDSISELQGDTVLKNIYGYIPRGAEYKIPRDFLTGDFRHRSTRAMMSAWHMFRILNQTDFINGITHTPDITKMLDSEQYLRIFDETSEESGDHFNVIYQIKAKAMIHAKSLYDTYDFESEGKEILLNGNGPKAN